MTAPITSFTIHINDDGTASFQAPDWSQEGHTWAIPSREIPLDRVRRIAEILGPDARAGFEARVTATRERLERQVSTEETVLRRVREAVDALERFNSATLGPVEPGGPV